MRKASPDMLIAKVGTNYPIKTAPSYVINQLRNTVWIPDKDNKFRKATDMTKNMLNKDFPYDDRNGWLTAIGFGENEKKKTEEYKGIRTILKKMGFSEKIIEKLPDLAKLPEDQQIKIAAEIQESKFKAAFPEKESPDPARRAKKVAGSLADAPEKSYEIRERSVRISNGEVKIIAKEYLQDCYTNPDGEMVCQICEDVMPFKLDDGSYYFETVELLRDFSKECSEKYLALCPVCSAKYQYANGSKVDDLKEAFLNSDSLEIPVVLARESASIRFVKVHLEDLRTVLNGSE